MKVSTHNFLPNRDIKIQEIKKMYEGAMNNSTLILGEINRIDSQGNIIVNLSGANGFVTKNDIFIDDNTNSDINKELNDLILQKHSYFIVKEVSILNSKINIKLSRKDAMAIIRKELLSNVNIGDSIVGRVKSIQPYALFIDVGSDIVGMLHQSNVNIQTSFNFIKKGDYIEVEVLSFDKDNLYIEFKITNLEDPWKTYPLNEGDRLNGIIRSYLKKGGLVTGLFVELHPGIEGLLSLDSMDKVKFDKLSLTFIIGDKISVKVLKVDKNRKRIKLGLVV